MRQVGEREGGRTCPRTASCFHGPCQCTKQVRGHHNMFSNRASHSTCLPHQPAPFLSPTGKQFWASAGKPKNHCFTWNHLHGIPLLHAPLHNKSLLKLLKQRNLTWLRTQERHILQRQTSNIIFLQFFQLSHSQGQALMPKQHKSLTIISISIHCSFAWTTRATNEEVVFLFWQCFLH